MQNKITVFLITDKKEEHKVAKSLKLNTKRLINALMMQLHYIKFICNGNSRKSCWLSF